MSAGAAEHASPTSSMMAADGSSSKEPRAILYAELAPNSSILFWSRSSPIGHSMRRLCWVQHTEKRCMPSAAGCRFGLVTKPPT
eukprot:5276831-Prymnesium_polylepis.1